MSAYLADLCSSAESAVPGAKAAARIWGEGRGKDKVLNAAV